MKESPRLLPPSTTRLIAAVLLCAGFVWAFAGGSISGIVRDQSGGAISGAQVALVNNGLKTEFKETSDARGFYSFPALPVGRYDLTIEATGFKPQKKTNLAVDADSALTVDAALEIGQRSDVVTVTDTESSTQTQVESVATHLGEVVETSRSRRCL